MTGPKGKIEFCFPKTLNVVIVVKGKQNPRGQSLCVLLYLPTQKYEKQVIDHKKLQEDIS